jgi:hypothetical protein
VKKDINIFLSCDIIGIVNKHSDFGNIAHYDKDRVMYLKGHRETTNNIHTDGFLGSRRDGERLGESKLSIHKF